MARALFMSSRLSVRPIVGAVWVSDISGVGVVDDVDGRRCFWPWVRVRGVFGLLWVLVMIFVVWPCWCWAALPGGG